MISERAELPQAGSGEQDEAPKQHEPAHGPRKPIDAARLRRLTDSLPMQKEGAVAVTRALRDRY